MKLILSVLLIGLIVPAIFAADLVQSFTPEDVSRLEKGAFC
jgi:hypothetical protein